MPERVLNWRIKHSILFYYGNHTPRLLNHTSKTIKKIALTRILETVVTFHFSGGKVYSMYKGGHICMIKHTMHVQSLHYSTYLTWLDVCIYVPRSHFHFLKRMLGKGQLRTA